MRRTGHVSTPCLHTSLRMCVKEYVLDCLDRLVNGLVMVESAILMGEGGALGKRNADTGDEVGGGQEREGDGKEGSLAEHDGG